jgi:hypothetical protein
MSKQKANGGKTDTCVRFHEFTEFTELPEFTVPQWHGDKMLNEADPYKWSGDKAPPEIGTNVKIYLSNLGTGDVLGYFAEYGWLGVRVKLNNPPDWYPVNRNAHLFGVDLTRGRDPPAAMRCSVMALMGKAFDAYHNKGKRSLQ